MALGKATRLIEFLEDQPKRYRAEMLLGLSTATLDLEGEVLRCEPVRQVTREQVEEVFRGFVGGYDQVPPMFSAIHHQGKRLYELARKGIEVQRKPRRVEIYHLALLRLEPDGPSWRLLFDVTCSRGTYVRTLCADIGEQLGYGGCLAFLIRTATGPFLLESSYTLEELADAARQAKFGELLLPMDFPLSDLPKATVDQKAVARLLHGSRLPETAVAWDEASRPAVGQPVRLYAPNGTFLAIASLDGASGLTMRKILSQEEDVRCRY